MTDFQKCEYAKRYEIENYLCYKTNSLATQMAHRIANNKTNRKKYGKLIDHNFNLVPVSSLEINDSFNIGMNDIRSLILIRLINENGNQIIKAESITELLGG
jgi:hypothetical protein